MYKGVFKTNIVELPGFCKLVLRTFNIKLIFHFFTWQGNSRFSPDQFPYKLKCAEPDNHIHRFHGTL